MRKMVWMVVCLLSTAMACAQSAKQILAGLQNSMGNEQLVLRNFSGEEVVRATWDGTQLVLAPARWRTTAVVQLKSAKLGSGKVTLNCVRDVIVKDAKDQLALYPGSSEFKIEIEFGNADAATVLARVKDDLFFASSEEAIAAIPAGWNKTVPTRIDWFPGAKKVNNAGPKQPCDCAAKGGTTCDADSMQKTGMEPPKALKTKDPDFPPAARKEPVNAEVVVALIVDETGHPVDVWVLRPAGMGMDEAAAKAVLQYSFRPAMCHNNPVRVYLDVDVHFQRY